MILAIDMSLRSTGICIIDFNDNLIHFEILKTEPEDFLFDEDLVLYITNIIDIIIRDFIDDITQVVIEGLSFNSKSTRSDVIAGVHWSIRSMIRSKYYNILIGCVPVRSWRSWVVPNKEMKKIKKICKDHVKNAPLMKLSFDIYNQFMKYIVNNNIEITSIFDLSDAYWLGRYRNFLNK